MLLLLIILMLLLLFIIKSAHMQQRCTGTMVCWAGQQQHCDSVHGATLNQMLSVIIMSWPSCALVVCDATACHAGEAD